MRGRAGATAALVSIALVACSSGDDSADVTTIVESTSVPSTTAAPTTAAPATIVHTTTTAVAATTDPVPTTESTMAPTTSSTTSSTAVDVDDEVAAFEAVVEAANLSWEVYTAVLMDPENDDKVAELSAVFTDGVVGGWMAIIEDYRTNGFRLLERPDQPGSYDVVLSSVAVDLESGRATLQVCNIDTFIKVRADSSGNEVVIDDGVSAQMEELTLVLDDGRWKVDDARTPESADQLAPCVAP